jgi:hypothetical protein
MAQGWMIFCPKKRWRPEKSDFNHFVTTGFVGKTKRAPELLMKINTRGFFLASGFHV